MLSLAGSPPDGPRVYGQDFSIPLPPGFKVIRDRDSTGKGYEVQVRADAPSQEWSVDRGLPLPGPLTQEACQGLLDGQLRRRIASDATVVVRQAIAIPPSSCRYRIAFADKRELRVFIISDALRTFVTTCGTGPDASADQSCTLLTDGFFHMQPDTVRVAGLSVPVPPGFFVKGHDRWQWPDAIALAEKPSKGRYQRTFLIEVQSPGEPILPCDAAAEKLARAVRLQVIQSGKGEGSIRCRAVLSPGDKGTGKAEVRWRSVGSRSVIVSCAMTNSDTEARACDDLTAAISPLAK
jgi:hypothetical protein